MFYEDGDPYSTNARHHSQVLVTMTAQADPAISLTFAACQDAPGAWLIDAFLLATGRPQEGGRYSSVDGYDHDVQSLTFGGTMIRDIPGLTGGCRIEVCGSRRAEPGEPHVQLLDEDATKKAAPHWQSSAAPLRREHVQQELTRRFGVITPAVDTSGRAELSRDIGSSQVESLLMDLPPERRLALRAHLTDSGLINPAPLDPAFAADLLSGLRWLTDRLGADGVEQEEHGGFPFELAREAEAALSWSPTLFSPPSPGHALFALGRSSRFVRRFRGRMLSTIRARTAEDKPLRALSELEQPRWGSHYGWNSDPARTLALLTIADGSAADPAAAARYVAEGLDVRTSARGDKDTTTQARQTIEKLMATLAPLGGVGGYGTFTPAVRSYAHAQLFPQSLPRG